MDFKDFFDERANIEKKVTAAELPEGTYIAEVIECKFDKTKAGDDKVFWDLKVVDGQYVSSHHWIHAKFSRTDRSDEAVRNLDKMLAYFKALDLPCTSAAIGTSMANIKGKKIEFKIVAGTRGGMFTNFIRIVPDNDMPPASASPF